MVAAGQSQPWRLAPEKGGPLMRRRAIAGVVAVLVAALLALAGVLHYGNSLQSAGSGRDLASVLWITDLYEPVNDPDDHYDFAVAMATPGLEPDMIVLDDHLSRQSGQAPAVNDMVELLDRPAPIVVLDSEVGAQLDWLAGQEDGSVTVVSLGALTALADLVESDPALASSKVKEVILVAGDAAPGAQMEYNVAQDPEAFLAVVDSNLPIRWIPAFDGGLWSAGTSAYTVTNDVELLQGVHPEVRSWFEHFIGERFGVRNLWAAGVLAEPLVGAQWKEEVVRFDDQGRVDPDGPHETRLLRLVVDDRESFEVYMVQSTNAALASLTPAKRATD